MVVVVVVVVYFVIDSVRKLLGTHSYSHCAVKFKIIDKLSVLIRTM